MLFNPFYFILDQYSVVGFMLLPLLFSKSGRGQKVSQRSSERTSAKQKSPLVRISQRDQLECFINFVGVSRY